MRGLPSHVSGGWRGKIKEWWRGGGVNQVCVCVRVFEWEKKGAGEGVRLRRAHKAGDAAVGTEQKVKARVEFQRLS